MLMSMLFSFLQATEDGDPMDTEAVDSDLDQEEEGENAQQVEMAAARNLRGILDPHDHPSSHTYGGCKPLTSRYGPAAALLDLAHKAEQDSSAAVKAEGSADNAVVTPEQTTTEPDQEALQADPSRIMYGNEAFLIFFRLHHYLYDRCGGSALQVAKEVSEVACLAGWHVGTMSLVQSSSVDCSGVCVCTSHAISCLQ